MVTRLVVAGVSEASVADEEGVTTGKDDVASVSGPDCSVVEPLPWSLQPATLPLASVLTSQALSELAKTPVVPMAIKPPSEVSRIPEKRLNSEPTANTCWNNSLPEASVSASQDASGPPRPPVTPSRPARM